MVPQLRRKNGVPQFFPQVKEFFRQRDVLSLVMQKEGNGIKVERMSIFFLDYPSRPASCTF